MQETGVIKKKVAEAEAEADGSMSRGSKGKFRGETMTIGQSESTTRMTRKLTVGIKRRRQPYGETDGRTEGEARVRKRKGQLSGGECIAARLGEKHWTSSLYAPRKTNIRTKKERASEREREKKMAIIE